MWGMAGALADGAGPRGVAAPLGNNAAQASPMQRRLSNALASSLYGLSTPPPTHHQRRSPAPAPAPQCHSPQNSQARCSSSPAAAGPSGAAHGLRMTSPRSAAQTQTSPRNVSAAAGASSCSSPSTAVHVVSYLAAFGRAGRWEVGCRRRSSNGVNGPADWLTRLGQLAAVAQRATCAPPPCS